MNKNKRAIIVVVLLSVMIVCSLGALAPEVKASPNIQIAVGQGFFNADNFYTVVGEVKNAGSNAVKNVVVTVNGYDILDQIVWSAEATPDLAVINPGARSGFTTTETYGGQPGSITYVSATLKSATETTSSPVGFQIAVTNANMGATPSIIGNAVHTGADESGIVNIYVTYYDSRGNAVGAGSEQYDVTDPGNTWQFEVHVDNMAPNSYAVAYMVTASSSDDAGNPGQYVATEVSTIAFSPQVTTSASSTAAPSLTSAPATSSPSTSQTTSPSTSQTISPSTTLAAPPTTNQTASPSTNQTPTASPSAPSSFPLWIGLVAAAVVVTVIVVSFVLLRKRPKPYRLQPMPPPPPPP